MKRLVLITFSATAALLLLLRFFGAINSVRAESQDERMKRLTEEIAQYQQEIGRLKSQAATLANQISQFDAQINLTTVRISETEGKIAQLGGRIDQLEISLQTLTEAYLTRTVKSYKMSRLQDPYMILLSAPDLKTAVSNYHYLTKIQEADRDLLTRLESAQLSYEEEKVNQEDLQKQLEQQQQVLGTQKQAKATLLEGRKNEEKKYQQLLAPSKAEFEAIQAIIAGKGSEEEAGKVSQGQRIASVIQGPSCNSSGQHLHFIVSSNGIAQNPFSYLKSIDHTNCSGSNCGSSDGDPFNPSGSWDWPIAPKIKFTQGYGATWAVRNTWVGRVYSQHNGIDIDSPSSEVRSVKAGTLYRGSYTGANGCRLRYVRVAHEEGGLDTLYLHINY